MVTHESLKEWLAVQGHPLEVVEDPRTGMPIYVLQQRSDVAKMRYLGLLAIPPGRFMMVKVVGCSVEKYHPRACEAVLTQFNGLLNRRKTKDSYNYVIDKGHLAIVFWPETRRRTKWAGSCSSASTVSTLCFATWNGSTSKGEGPAAGRPGWRRRGSRGRENFSGPLLTKEALRCIIIE